MMVLLIFFLVFILSIISYSSAIKHIKKEAQSRLETMAKTFSGQFESQLKEKEAIAKMLEAQIQSTFSLEQLSSDSNYMVSYLGELEKFMKNAAKYFSDTWVFFNPEITDEAYDIWFYDEFHTGEALRMPMLSKDSYIDGDPSMEWFFLPLHKRKAVWINPYSYNITDGKSTMFVTYSYPIIINDVPIAVTGTDFDFQYLFRDIIAFKPYQKGYVTVLDKDYNIIVHPDYMNGENGREKDINILSSIINASDEGIYEVEESMVSYAKTNNGWIFIIIAPKAIIYSAANSQLFIMIITSIIGVLIALILGIYLIRKLIFPLEKLTHAVAIIGTGNYNIVLDQDLLEDPTEIGLLSKAIDEMKELQNKYFNEAQTLNNELENLVELRTQELSDSYNQLEISLDKLKALQMEIIEKEKKSTAAQIMMELSHRVNTPLGASITYISYVKKEFQKLTFDASIHLSISDIQNAVDQIEHQMIKISDIMKFLSNVMSQIENAELQHVNLKNTCTQSFNLLQMNTNYASQITIDIQWTDDIEIVTYPTLIQIVIEELVNFSVIHREPTDKSDIVITFSKKEYGLSIRYQDASSLLHLEPVSFSEPFGYDAFKTGTQGLEIYLAEKIISDGLKGQIILNDVDPITPYFEIELPSLDKDI